ncbi:MAG: signal peptidase II [Zoogloeaceae bacterium]|jgi:signal peptidase II|nr:signal peptidase II [Zoogloeaceae bacterium]
MTLFFRYLLVAGLVFLADQATKLMILANFAMGEYVTLTPFFNLTLLYNPGAAFSFLADASGWQRWFFVFLALAISLWILVLFWRHPERYRENIALALIMGGALGNAADRLAYGAVVDFLDFHLGGYSWPAFNLADTGITIGAALLVLDAWLAGRAGRKIMPDASA